MGESGTQLRGSLIIRPDSSESSSDSERSEEWESGAAVPASQLRGTVIVHDHAVLNTMILRSSTCPVPAGDCVDPDEERI